MGAADRVSESRAVCGRCRADDVRVHFGLLRADGFSGEWQPVRNQDNSENCFQETGWEFLNEAGWLGRKRGTLRSLPCQNGSAGRTDGPISIGARQRFAFGARSIRSRGTSLHFTCSGSNHRRHRSISTAALIRQITAPDSWMGSSTAKWEGNVLKLRRPIERGLRPAQRHLCQRQGDRHHLLDASRRLSNLVNIVKDPVYPTEPLTERRVPLESRRCVPRAPLHPGRRGLSEGVVPAHLPGKNPFLKEPRPSMKTPEELLRAGAESMYPEFKAKLPKP